ncbi:type III pantothenate kinase [Thiorhodospira sibirica]|uniref:type III pantothenate kinase n=1 Tax=Thiorhodospira sibirica TaxID=154347 RepID=UPI00022C4CA2|nr:type III pantothenate kinase [Thiorhodospira sibirica]
MAFLLLDAGNTRLKWRWLDDLHHPSHSTALPYAAHARARLFAHLGKLPRPDQGIYLASVLAEDFCNDFRAWCQQHAWPMPYTVSAADILALGLRSAYSEPQRLGIDRYLAMLGARHHYPDGALLVIDAGSALTLDYLDADNLHRGGLILPGVGLMRRALSSELAALPPTEGNTITPLACNTADGIHSGTLLGLAAAIEGLCAQISNTVPTPAHTLLTGGDASMLQPWLHGDYACVDDLVLEGLAVLAGEHRRG